MCISAAREDDIDNHSFPCMRPFGSPADLEARGRRAVAVIDGGLGVREVARQIGCSPASVSRWHAEVQSWGPDGLRPKPAPGRPPRNTARQRAKPLKLPLKGASAHGFSTDLWTFPRVATVIARTLNEGRSTAAPITTGPQQHLAHHVE